MVKRHDKAADGLYHVGKSKYEKLSGSRAEVWHGTAYKTSGDLKKGDLMKNKHGRIVSKSKHQTAKKEKRLEKAGYKPVKGKFVAMRKSMRKSSKSHKNKSRRH
jgi:hypothetical protein